MFPQFSGLFLTVTFDQRQKGLPVEIAAAEWGVKGIIRTLRVVRSLSGLSLARETLFSAEFLPFFGDFFGGKNRAEGRGTGGPISLGNQITKRPIPNIS